MSVVRCIEKLPDGSQCSCIISDPCYVVPVLMGHMLKIEKMIEEIKSNEISITNKVNISLLKNHLDETKKLLTDIGLQDTDKQYRIYKEKDSDNTIAFIKSPEKWFTLECKNGHRNTYCMNCP